MMQRVRSALRPTFAKVIGISIAVCFAGWLGAEYAIDRQKAEGRQRIAVRDHNMDVAMGAMWESIRETVKVSGVCQGRGIFCTWDGPEGGWYWHRQSVRGPDVIDVIIPEIFDMGTRSVRVSVFMRDKSGNVGSLHAPMVPALNAVLRLFGVSSAGVAECMAERGSRTFTDGALKLTCEKRIPAYYYARDASGVEGSSWNMTIELPG